MHVIVRLSLAAMLPFIHTDFALAQTRDDVPPLGEHGSPPRPDSSPDEGEKDGGPSGGGSTQQLPPQDLNRSGGVVVPPPTEDKGAVPPPNQEKSRTPVITPRPAPNGNSTEPPDTMGPPITPNGDTLEPPPLPDGNSTERPK